MNGPGHFFREYGAPLAFGPALAALLGSLYYSEFAGFTPCTLCWYQRILMYPLSVILLVGFLSGDRFLPRLVLPFSVSGMAVSLYHYLLQNNIVGEAGICRAGIPCHIRYINYAGFITIPFLALIAFSLISLLMFAVVLAGPGEKDEALASG